MFPAYAGVIPRAGIGQPRSAGVPRLRGGDFFGSVCVFVLVSASQVFPSYCIGGLYVRLCAFTGQWVVRIRRVLFLCCGSWRAVTSCGSRFDAVQEGASMSEYSEISVDRGTARDGEPGGVSKVLVARVDVRCDAESLSALDGVLRDFLNSHPGARADVVSISRSA